MAHACRISLLFLFGTCAAFVPAAGRAGVNYEEAPIRYSTSRDETAISRLQSRLDAGEANFEFEEPHGYLKSLLRKLSIPVSSQVLVFSKTSLQTGKISPRTPRAIYFNDEVHVGYVQDGLIEIAAADPQLGTVFYTLDPERAERPVLERQNNRCLNCHGGSRTGNVPGLLVRSVFPDPNGRPVIAAGSFVSTHASPLAQRWGGWYVTGTHGDQKHLGNLRLADGKKPGAIDNSPGHNVTSLAGQFETSLYLSPHSDLVALMVLEHQTDGYNRLTQANYEVHHAQYIRDHAVHSATPDFEATDAELHRRIAAIADKLVPFLLFADESLLTSPVAGVTDFSREFSELGRERGQPSLRELDLQTRLFKYPCSYLIYTPAFRGLPEALRRSICQRLQSAMDADSPLPSIQRLTPVEREAMSAILAETVADWPHR